MMSKFTKKLAANICSQIAAGNSLTKICASPTMPDRRTVYRWLDSGLPEYSEFLKNFIRARQLQSDVWFEKGLETIDSTPERYIDDLGNDRIDPVSAQRAKNRAYFYFQKACQLLPRKYSTDYITKPESTITGGLPAV